METVDPWFTLMFHVHLFLTEPEEVLLPSQTVPAYGRIVNGTQTGVSQVFLIAYVTQVGAFCSGNQGLNAQQPIKSIT